MDDLGGTPTIFGNIHIFFTERESLFGKHHFQLPFLSFGKSKPYYHRIHGTVGIFIYIAHTIQPNVGRYTIHGAYGYRYHGNMAYVGRFAPFNDVTFMVSRYRKMSKGQRD